MATPSGKDNQKESDRWDEICGNDDELDSQEIRTASSVSSPAHNNKPPNLNLANIPPSPTFGSHWSFHNHNKNQNSDEGKNRRPRHRSSSTDGRSFMSSSSSSLLDSREDRRANKPQSPQNKTPGVIKLENTWTFWFDERPAKAGTGSEDYESRIKEIGSFNTVQDFWRYWNNIDITKFAENTNLRLFKHGIRPSWEDPANVHGGKWIFYVAKELTGKIWGHLVLGLIGEQLESGDDVNGVVLAIRGRNNNISIWNKTSGDTNVIESIGQQVRKLLSLDDHTRIVYQSHTSTAEFTKQFTTQPSNQSTPSAQPRQQSDQPTQQQQQQQQETQPSDKNFNLGSPSNFTNRGRRRSSGSIPVGNNRRNSYGDGGNNDEVEEIDDRIVQTGIAKSESCPRIEDFYRNTSTSTSPSISPKTSPRTLRTSREDIDEDSNKSSIRKRVAGVKSFASAPLTPPPHKVADWQRHRKSPSDSTYNKSKQVTVIVESPIGFTIETTPSRASSKSPRRGRASESDSSDQEMPKIETSQKSELPPLYPRAPKAASVKKGSKTNSKKSSSSNLRMKRTPSDQDVPLQAISNSNSPETKGNDVQNSLDRNNSALPTSSSTPNAATTTTSSAATTVPAPKDSKPHKKSTPASFSWIYMVVASLLFIAVLLYLLQQTSLNSYIVQSG
eukprot:TRINITY_DN2886_c0_g1_i1.p1 TRINITY_DN2886_c0_g1~~TRINITY_DN2886_c0_g1_i1.p1  ORF type:complete len:671 (+),score=136.06 TRINITY_DN2886_c0_g1_i1:291-2303(+)